MARGQPATRHGINRGCGRRSGSLASRESYGVGYRRYLCSPDGKAPISFRPWPWRTSRKSRYLITSLTQIPGLGRSGKPGPSFVGPTASTWPKRKKHQHSLTFRSRRSQTQTSAASMSCPTSLRRKRISPRSAGKRSSPTWLPSRKLFAKRGTPCPQSRAMLSVWEPLGRAH